MKRGILIIGDVIMWIGLAMWIGGSEIQTTGQNLGYFVSVGGFFVLLVGLAITVHGALSKKRT